MQSESSAEDYFRRLFHRWFIQYNPLYLLSAVLVLYGLYSIEGAFANERSITGHLVVFGVTELYSLALILGGALLVRIGLRRPAVFVALLAVLYQGDPAFGTESFALFGRMGQLASFGWLLLFVAKLHLLAWALQLRLSRSALVVPSFGALGLAAIPHVARLVDARSLTTIVGLWLFSLFALGAWSAREVTSKTALDDWGRTVLRRALLATWSLWALLAVAYAAFWTNNYHLDRGLFLTVGALLATRLLRHELSVFLVVAGTLLLVAVVSPQLLSFACAASAIVFAFHALRKPVVLAFADGSPEVYRGGPAHAPEPLIAHLVAPPAALARQLAWAGYCLHLSAWTSSWSGGALPPHLFAIDALLVMYLALILWRERRWIILSPAITGAMQWSIAAHLVRAPRSPLEWGASTVGLGFALLLASLLASWRVQRLAQTGLAFEACTRDP
jgi:hypothetical protein